MHNFIRFYNKNRMQIGLLIIIIIFILFIISTLNSMEKERRELRIQNDEIVLGNNSYSEESQSIVSRERVSNYVSIEYGGILDSFLSKCISGNYEEAYRLLSKDCQEELYPSLQIFIDRYCNGKFDSNKKYSFQAWSSNIETIYYVKIFENPLITGRVIDSHIEDYYSIVEENGEYKLNISSFVRKVNNIDMSKEIEKVNINVIATKIYMDYQIYEIVIENNSENMILLDTMKKIGTMYIIDSNGAKQSGLLHENTKEQLMLNSGETKNIEIKFSNIYQHSKGISKMVFSDFVFNYQEYIEGNETSKVVEL